MSMFTPYENLNPDYSPNNMTRGIVTKLPYGREVIPKGVPVMEKNITGKFVGGAFNYGDTLPLEFYINPRVRVEKDALILSSDEEPTTGTAGFLGQRAYNGDTMREWVCETLDQTVYMWREEPEFSFPIYSPDGLEIVVKPFGDVVWTAAEVYIKNFRREEILSFSTEDGSAVIDGDSVKINITEDSYKSDEEDLIKAPKKLLKGIYSTTIKLTAENSVKVVYEYPLIIK